jgi:uncharacterized membrane protein
MMVIRPESRTKFEKLGLSFVRTDIIMGHTIQDGKENTEAQEWMAEQEQQKRRQESWRYYLLLVFTIIASVGAAIAAWPIVKEWLGWH